MRVDWAIPCRYVEVQPGGGATIVGAGADLMTVQSLPAAVQVLFAVRYVGAPEEFSEEATHEIGCRIFDPSGEQVGEQTAQLSVGIEQIVTGYAAAVVVPTAILLDVRHAGTYGVEFSIEDHELRMPIHIVSA